MDMKTYKGINGQIELHDNKIVIRRKGILSKLTQGFLVGEKTIYIPQITSIKTKKAGFLTNGFIQFVLSGNIEYKKGIVNMTQDENTVMFSRKQQEDMNELVSTIEDSLSKRYAI